MKNSLSGLSNKNLRDEAKKITDKCPLAFNITSTDDLKKLIEELQIHQVELEMQNEELRQTQLELIETREEYTDLYDFAPVGYFMTDKLGKILNTNLTGAFLLGVERSFLIGKFFSKFIERNNQDVFYRHRQTLIETKNKHSCELKLVKKDGSQFYVQMDCIPVLAEDGNVNQIRTTILDITERKQAEIEIKEHRAELQNLSIRLMSTQEEERKKLSHELHDELGQALTALAINLSKINNLPLLKCDSQVSERLSESLKLVDHMSGQLHEMILDLRPLMLDDLGLIPTLRWYIKQFIARTQISVTLNTSILKSKLTKKINIVLYRFIQEALTNVVKHAKAQNVIINMNEGNNLLIVSIEDDGQGFDLNLLADMPVQNRGTGHLGMQERLLAVNGTLDISSKIGKGTRLDIIIPLGGDE